MAPQLLVGSALMVGLLVAVLLVTARGRGWYRYTPQTSREGVGWTPRTAPAGSGGLLSRTGTWIAGFFLLTALAVLGVFLFAPGAVGGSSTLLLAAVAGLVVLYMVGGVYLVARQRGHSNALAVMESATVSGVVFLALVVVQLVVLG